MIVAGCDIGAFAGKAVVLSDGEILASAVVPLGPDTEETARAAVEEALRSVNLTFDDLAHVTATGFGEVDVPFAQSVETEVSCHARGAYWLDSGARTVIDVGGQDCKTIRVAENGAVADFVLNDKCAAGTGQFLVDIAGILETEVTELGPLSLQAEKPVTITNQCSVFALSEIISLVAENETIPDIVAGIHDSIAARLLSMVHKVGLEEKVFLSSGLAKNVGFVASLEKMLGVQLADPSPVDPQIIGALGAALFAKGAVKG